MISICTGSSNAFWLYPAKLPIWLIGICNSLPIVTGGVGRTSGFPIVSRSFSLRQYLLSENPLVQASVITTSYFEVRLSVYWTPVSLKWNSLGQYCVTSRLRTLDKECQDLKTLLVGPHNNIRRLCRFENLKSCYHY